MKIFSLLENQKTDLDKKNNHYFTDPVAEIVCNTADDLFIALDHLENLRQKGNYLVGFVSYEAGYYLQKKLKAIEPKLQPIKVPLLQFYAFAHHETLTHPETEKLLEELSTNFQTESFIYNLQPPFAKSDYFEKIKTIKNYLQAGECYQVNLTGKYHFNFQGEPIGLYRVLRQQQKVRYSAILNFPNLQILSLSPELFFKKNNEKIMAQPMKGTLARATSLIDDNKNKQFFSIDEKNLAENLMIVDLLRNDLGKIAKTGSIMVDDLFQVETYETLHQMISTVSARIDSNLCLKDILQALFPCGSVTGAPKLRTMQIIHALETEARGIYTGALGYIMPNHDMCFNVPIRTVVLQDKQGELGVGSGIICDSQSESEWQEIQVKAKFLTSADLGFDLIECFFYSTITGYRYLDQHLFRLQESASLFNFVCPLPAIKTYLSTIEKNLLDSDAYKIKLLLNKNGIFQVVTEKILPTHKNLTYSIVLAHEPIDSKNLLWQHKTTAHSTRGFYENMHKKYCTQPEIFDVIFLNENGYVTEGTRCNIFVKMNDKIYTSPPHCGLLPGIMRARFIEEYAVIEKPITLQDLQMAEEVWLTNSVRGPLIIKSEMANRKSDGFATDIIY